MSQRSDRLSNVTEIDIPVAEHLAGVGAIVRTFGERKDSRAEIFGLDVDGDRFVVKHATDDEAVGWLESALRFHAVVRHPVIATVVHHFRAPGGGLALVEEWAPGEVLHDPFDPSVPARDASDSPYQRFLDLPPEEIAAAVGQLIDAHVAVADAGFVAVDLYDGCLLYDFTARQLHLVDLDCYRPGPYVLEVDRQLGSTAFMAPEEHRRGATIDERTTVFTLGRFAHVLLGDDRHGRPRQSRWRAGPTLFDVASRACDTDPARRFPSVRTLAAAWEEGRGVRRHSAPAEGG